jgi:hypothetical protein
MAAFSLALGAEPAVCKQCICMCPNLVWSVYVCASISCEVYMHVPKFCVKSVYVCAQILCKKCICMCLNLVWSVYMHVPKFCVKYVPKSVHTYTCRVHMYAHTSRVPLKLSSAAAVVSTWASVLTTHHVHMHMDRPWQNLIILGKKSFIKIKRKKLELRFSGFQGSHDVLSSMGFRASVQVVSMPWKANRKAHLVVSVMCASTVVLYKNTVIMQIASIPGHTML